MTKGIIIRAQHLLLMPRLTEINVLFSSGRLVFILEKVTSSFFVVLLGCCLWKFTRYSQFITLYLKKLDALILLIPETDETGVHQGKSHTF